MGVSRRRFLTRIGAAGGSAALYSAMVGLGLMAVPARAGPLSLPASLGAGKSVVVLGGGIAGLTAAYELERAGFAVTLLEARARLGGRNWTLRGGDPIEMVGEATQTVGFSDGLYMNAGPARIPSNHRMLLDYCRELGVELMPFINDNRNAWIQDDAMFGGRPVRNREYVADTRGFIADARFTYRATFNNDLIQEGLNETGGNLNNWAVGASLGYEF